MGTWGTAIYSNDMAEDVRDACKEIFAFYDVEEGNRILFEEFREIINQGWIDNEYASFWYALADWQWKHGMLTPEVQNKALELLTEYVGIAEWEEAGNSKDVTKRRKVLDALRIQLQSPQPPLKKPKVRLEKPKHKPGDIIIFKATEYIDEWDSAWHKKRLSPPYKFKSEIIAESEYENIEGYDAHGKYMAVLCVGSQKEAYSEYVPDAFDEYSVYVWYNYMSDIKPSVEQLASCGFLPMIVHRLKDFNKKITESVYWVYQFTLISESFKESPYIIFENKERGNLQEVNRFKLLLAYKGYSEDYHDGYDLVSMFNTAFGEKNRMELLGLTIDDLTDKDVQNPEFLSPLEIDAAYKAWREKERKAF